MDRGNSCKTRIVSVQSGRHGRKSRQQPIDRQMCSIGSAKEAFDLGTPAYSKSGSLPFNQRRAAKEQAVISEANTEITLAIFAQTPNSMHGGSKDGGLVESCKREGWAIIAPLGQELKKANLPVRT